MVDIFDEVSEDLRAERAQALLKRYGILLVLAAVLAVVGVAGWQAWRWRSTQQASEAATLYLDAMRKSTPTAVGVDVPTATREDALKSFLTLSASGPEGYRTLARLRAASLKISLGDRAGGLALLDQISADTAADSLLRGLADLVWVQNQVDDGNPPAVEGRLAGLLVPGNAWRPMAMEVQAWLFMRTGRDAQARDVLKQLQADQSAPEGVRGRAGWLLTRLGEAPAAGVGG